MKAEEVSACGYYWYLAPRAPHAVMVEVKPAATLQLGLTVRLVQRQYFTSIKLMRGDYYGSLTPPLVIRA